MPPALRWAELNFPVNNQPPFQDMVAYHVIEDFRRNKPTVLADMLQANLNIHFRSLRLLLLALKRCQIWLPTEILLHIGQIMGLIPSRLVL